MSSVSSWWQRIRRGYVRFVEREGFALILVTCIGVIVFTAVWTARTVPDAPAPTPPVDRARAAAQVQQESLRSAATPAPPTPAPRTWQPPLDEWSVLTPFSGTRLTQSGVTGLWRLHDAVDLHCRTGDPVRAMSEGRVTAVTEEGLMGASVIIDHGDGITAEYAGMAMTAGVRGGDPVDAGQTIGYGGNTVAEETDLGAHLHLRVTVKGQAVDPATLLPSQKERP